MKLCPSSTSGPWIQLRLSESMKPTSLRWSQQLRGIHTPEINNPSGMKKNEQDHGYDGYGQVRGCFEKPSKKPCPSTTMLLMGKSTISTGPFAIAMLNYQRVTQFKTMYTKPFFRPSGPSFAHREMTPQQGAFVNGTPGRNTCRNRVYFQSFLEVQFQIPSGNLTVCYGKSPCY